MILSAKTFVKWSNWYGIFVAVGNDAGCVALIGEFNELVSLSIDGEDVDGNIVGFEYFTSGIDKCSDGTFSGFLIVHDI